MSGVNWVVNGLFRRNFRRFIRAVYLVSKVRRACIGLCPVMMCIVWISGYIIHISRPCVRPYSVFEKRVQKVESSESSQKWVKMPFFLVLGSFHSHRLGQVSRTVNVAAPEVENKFFFFYENWENSYPSKLVFHSLEDCHVVGEQLEWNNTENSLESKSSYDRWFASLPFRECWIGRWQCCLRWSRNGDIN